MVKERKLNSLSKGLVCILAFLYVLHSVVLHWEGHLLEESKLYSI
jgi:hypothetical protein